MKTRSGFVSNSSSSSFVVVGTRIPRKELMEMGWYNDDGDESEKVPDGIAIYYDESDGGYIVGKPIVKSEDWGLSREEITYGDLQLIFGEVHDKLGRSVKLLLGTRPA